MISTIKTPLGNEIVVTEAPDHFEDGVLVVIKMVNHRTDSRRVDVLLDQTSLAELREALVGFQKSTHEMLPAEDMDKLAEEVYTDLDPSGQSWAMGDGPSPEDVIRSMLKLGFVRR
jgi:hypothetical protein